MLKISLANWQRRSGQIDLGYEQSHRAIQLPPIKYRPKLHPVLDDKWPTQIGRLEPRKKGHPSLVLVRGLVRTMCVINPAGGYQTMLHNP